MLVHRILYAMKLCMEQLPDDKLLPVLKTLMNIWTGENEKYQQNIQELQQIFLKDLKQVEKEDEKR